MEGYKHLRFFNGTQNELNLEWDDFNEYWSGTIHLPEVSTGLYETVNIFILEEVQDSTGYSLYSTPISTEAYPSGSKYIAEFETKVERAQSTDIFLYDTQLEGGVVKIKQLDSVELDTLDHTGVSPFVDGDIKQVAQYFNNALQINVAINSNLENQHNRILQIYDQSNGHLIAKINIYGETVAEDERFRDLLENFGAKLDDGDFMLFKDHDINEYSPDWILMNRKRKELLLELHNIKPFVGTYKAVLNAIDFFGYNNITLKEYWLNINQDSDSFGKLKAVPVPDTNTGFSYKKRKKFNLPSSTMKKTS